MSDNDEHLKESPSKSHLKREMLALQALGEKLVELSNEQIQQLKVPEALKEALLQAGRIRKHGARRRQLQYIGRLMRDLDADEIQAQYDNATQHSAASVARLHAIEKWRDRLLDGTDTALDDFLQRYPDADRQQLRQLLRSAHQEHLQNKAPKSYRKLFQFIKDLMPQ